MEVDEGIPHPLSVSGWKKKICEEILRPLFGGCFMLHKLFFRERKKKQIHHLQEKNFLTSKGKRKKINLPYLHFMLYRNKFAFLFPFPSK